jgi:hypothetical protein
MTATIDHPGCAHCLSADHPHLLWLPPHGVPPAAQRGRREARLARRRFLRTQLPRLPGSAHTFGGLASDLPAQRVAAAPVVSQRQLVRHRLATAGGIPDLVPCRLSVRCGSCPSLRQHVATFCDVSLRGEFRQARRPSCPRAVAAAPNLRSLGGAPLCCAPRAGLSSEAEADRRPLRRPPRTGRCPWSISPGAAGSTWCSVGAAFDLPCLPPVRLHTRPRRSSLSFPHFSRNAVGAPLFARQERPQSRPQNTAAADTVDALEEKIKSGTRKRNVFRGNCTGHSSSPHHLSRQQKSVPTRSVTWPAAGVAVSSSTAPKAEGHSSSTAKGRQDTPVG